MIKKPILCLDFDGVISKYEHGWQGATVIHDTPVDGLFEFLEEASAFFDIHVYSSRSHQEGGRQAMVDWLRAQWKDWLYTTHRQMIESYLTFNTLNICYYQDGIIEELFITIHFPLEKPPAAVTLDDRALTFLGIFPSLETLQNFVPWNKIENKFDI